jgi:hypothetical protein
MRRKLYKNTKNRGMRLGVDFNDIVDDETAGDWSQICSDCQRKYKFPEHKLDEYNIDNETICGIRRCDNIASLFITFDR